MQIEVFLESEKVKTVCRRSCRFERKKYGRPLASQGDIARKIYLCISNLK